MARLNWIFDYYQKVIICTSVILTLSLQESAFAGEIDNFDVETHPNWGLLPHNCRTPSEMWNATSEGSSTVPYFGEFPWMVLVFATLKGLVMREFSCGGYIINNRYVLTTASCCDKVSPETSRIHVGDYDLYHIGPECGPRGCDRAENYKVQEMVRFGKNLIEDVNHDMCLIRMRRRIRFTDFVKPICLPLREDIQEGEVLQFVGWFRPTVASPNTSLRKLDLSVVSGESCPGFNRHQDICVRRKEEDEILVQKSCPGNVGNVLMKTLYTGGRHVTYAVGHMSGIPLLHEPLCSKGVSIMFTRLSAYTKWILDNISP